MQKGLTFAQLENYVAQRDDYADTLSADRAIILIEENARQHARLILESAGVWLNLASAYRNGLARGARKVISAHFDGSGISVTFLSGSHDSVRIHKTVNHNVVEALVKQIRTEASGTSVIMIYPKLPIGKVVHEVDADAVCGVLAQDWDIEYASHDGILNFYAVRK